MAIDPKNDSILLAHDLLLQDENHSSLLGFFIENMLFFMFYKLVVELCIKSTNLTKKLLVLLVKLFVKV